MASPRCRSPFRTARAVPAALFALVVATWAVPSAAQWPVCGPYPNIPPVGSPEVRVVFVSFPEHTSPVLPCCECQDPIDNDNMPPWADAFATGLEEYLSWASNGEFTPNVQVVHRADPSQAGRNWRALNPSTYYRNNCTLGQSPHYGHLNAEMIQRIHEEHAANGNPNVWTGVAAVLVYNFESPWPHGGFLGVGGLGLPAGFDGTPYNFTAAGATMMLGCWEIDDPTVPNRVNRAAAHEFGHVFGLNHIPNTANISTSTGLPPVVCGQPAIDREFVNMGHYSVMDQSHPEPVPDPGFTAYHPMNLGTSLTAGSTGWTPVTSIQATPCNPQTVRVPPLHDDATGAIAKVSIPGTDQFYLLTNHQGDGEDAKYGGTGMLIWHIRPGFYWDLESAAGKTIAPPGMSGSPDPNTWWDALEADVCHMGSGNDFFTGAPGRNALGPTTNPNTNLYQFTYQQQFAHTGLRIENIRYDAGTSDMLADVSIDQGFTTFGPSDRYKPGDFMLVGWAICAATIDLYLSDANGSFTGATPLLSNAVNTGIYPHLIPATVTPGSGYRFRVVPVGNPAGAIDSPAFTIWKMTNVSATKIKDCCGNFKVRIEWDTSHPSQGMDRVTILGPGGISQQFWGGGYSTGTHHQYTIPLECIPGGTYTYSAQSNYSISGLDPYASTLSSNPPAGGSLTFVATNCGPTYPCPLPCEFEQQQSAPEIVDAVPTLGATTNPFQGATMLRFGLPRPASAEVAIYDVTGRRVRALVSGPLPAGEHELTWDGRDDTGRSLPAGLYFARAQANGVQLTEKLVRVP